MLTLVTATFSSAVPRNAPDEIVYIPVGSNQINATINGKPGKITVTVPEEKGQAIAAALQAALDRRLKNSVRPRLAFDHATTGPASGHPSSFKFDPARGIILSANWSASGRSAIEGGDYGYFSPTFLIDENGHPADLPEKGEIGSLVDEPAFRNIGLIAAADTDLQTTPTTTPMPKLIYAALAISAAAADAETEAVKAIDRLKVEASDAKAEAAKLKAENEALTKKVEAADAAAVAARKERAETLVKAAIADGRIAPKDEEKATKFRDRIAAGDTFAEEILATLPKANGGLGAPLVRPAAGGAVSASASGHAFESKARCLVAAGEAKSIDEALALVAASEPALYSDYLGTLRA